MKKNVIAAALLGSFACLAQADGVPQAASGDARAKCKYIARTFARNKTGNWVEVVGLLDEDRKVVRKLVATPTDEERAFAAKWLPDVDVRLWDDDDIELKAYVKTAKAALEIEKRKAAEGAAPLSDEELRARVRKVVECAEGAVLASGASSGSAGRLWKLVDIILDAPGFAARAYEHAVEKGAAVSRPVFANETVLRPGRIPEGRVAVPFVKDAGAHRLKIVECEVEGVKCRLVVDTGATACCLSTRFFEKLGKGDGAVEVQVASSNVKGGTQTRKVASFKVGDADFGEMALAVVPFGYSKADGLLGLSLLDSLPTLFSYGGDELVFNPADAEVAGFGSPLPLCNGGGERAVVVARHGGKPMRALIDTGASVSIVAPTANWPEAGEATRGSITTVNGSENRVKIPGARGEIRLGGVALELTPTIMGSARPKVIVGAQDLMACDIFIKDHALAFRRCP